jgi:hypothetical protein
MSGEDRWRWGSPQHAYAVRAAVLGLWLAIAASSHYGTYARLPHDMIIGRGLGRLLLGRPALKSFFLSYQVLVTLKWSAVLGCAVAILKPRSWLWVTPATCAIIVVLDLLTKSTNGYANHAQLVPLFVLLVFGFFGGRRYLPSQSAKVVWLASLMLIIPYTFIAMNRLIDGGPKLFLGDALLDDIALTSHWYAAYGFTVFLGLIAIPWLAASLKVGFFVTTLFELSSALTLVFRRFRMAWLAVIIGFHFITLFAMNIFFWENLVLSVVIFGWGIWREDASPVLVGVGQPPA